MKQAYNWIRQRKKLGGKFSKEDSLEEARAPIEEQTELMEEINPGEEQIEQPTETVEEKIGVDPMQEEAVVLRPLKKNHRTIRKRKKIGGELIEKEFEEQKSRIKDQINELPKQYRKAFLEELLKESE